MGILAILIVSFIAGVTNAVAGGGTFFTFPALTGFGGLSAKAANMTSTIGLWPGAAASVAAAKTELKRLPLGMTITFAIISLAGGIIGASLLRVTSPHAFGLFIPWLLLFATIIFACSKPIARWAGRGHGERSTRWTVFVAVAQLLVAIYGGYFGAGMSILMLAALSFAGLDDIHQMNGMKVLSVDDHQRHRLGDFRAQPAGELEAGASDGHAFGGGRVSGNHGGAARAAGGVAIDYSDDRRRADGGLFRQILWLIVRPAAMAIGVAANVENARIIRYTWGTAAWRQIPERCPSGRRSSTGNAVNSQGFRGFESRPLRCPRQTAIQRAR